MRVIGLFGQQSSGKSYCARAIASKMVNAEVISFAEPLKDRLQLIAPYGVDIRDDAIKNEPQNWLNGKTIREALQYDGHDLREKYGENTLANVVFKKIREADSPNRLFLIDDLRYSNEEKLIRNQGGKTLYVNNPSNNTVQHGKSHSSERDWPSFVPDFTLLNTYEDDEQILEFIKDNQFITFAYA